MNHRALILVASTTTFALLTSCKEEDPTQSAQYRQLEQDQARTEGVVHMKDSAINDLFGTFNRISENLRMVREKQGKLGDRSKDAEMSQDMEQTIMADIAAIDSLLEANKVMVAKLRKSAKGNEGRLAELMKTVEELERSVNEKDVEIGALKEQLSSTSTSLAQMIDMYRDKEQLANLQRTELNTAWYCVGTSKELRANNVLTKEGGVAGIGATNKLNSTTLNKDYFKQVDITQQLEISINAKKVKLATSHPAGTYRFEGEVEKLVIADPGQFWTMSKYLVVVVD